MPRTNDLEVRWIEQDVFQFLRAAEKAGTQYDLIVLDPPSFTKTRSGLRDALRGYRELHMRAFKLLIERRSAGDFFMLASRERHGIFANNLRCACRCPAFCATLAPVRAGA